MNYCYIILLLLVVVATGFPKFAMSRLKTMTWGEGRERGDYAAGFYCKA